MFEEITPYILAGGKSSRMGKDKRLLRIGSQTWLERSCQLAESVVGKKPVLVGDDLSGIAPEAYRVINDYLPDHGPLGGLVAALKDSKTIWILIMPIDLLCLSGADLQKLISYTRYELDVICLTRDERPEPLAALYHTRQYEFWRSLLESGELRTQVGIKKLKWKGIPIPPDSMALYNFNEIEDLKRLPR